MARLTRAIVVADANGARFVNTDEMVKPAWMDDELAHQAMRYSLTKAELVARRHGVREPHAVAGHPEHVPVPGHRRCVDRQDHRRSPTRPHPGRRADVARQVDVVPPAPDQPVPPSVDAARLERAMFEIKRVIVGQDRLVERMLVGLLARGHVLLEGVPGVAKTLVVRSFARALGLDQCLIQRLDSGPNAVVDVGDFECLGGSSRADWSRAIAWPFSE